ncbi:MAG: hypothetical protein VX062_07160 [Bacteroidota bacterium]|nr:hypothetical protein [Bacteroidota bacterium]
MVKSTRTRILRRFSMFLVLVLPLLHCSPTTYIPPDTSGIQTLSNTIEYEQNAEDIWTKLSHYISQSSYGLDSLDAKNYYAELSFISKRFHKYLDGGTLDEGGFNGYKGDFLELVLPTNDYKSTLTCKIRIQLTQNNLSTTTLRFLVSYETIYAKTKNNVLSEYKFDSQKPILISSENPAINFTIVSSFLLEKQLYESFSKFH